MHLHGKRTHRVNSVHDRMPLDVPLGEQTFLLKSLPRLHTRTKLGPICRRSCSSRCQYLHLFLYPLTPCLRARQLLLDRCFRKPSLLLRNITRTSLFHRLLALLAVVSPFLKSCMCIVLLERLYLSNAGYVQLL